MKLWKSVILGVLALSAAGLAAGGASSAEVGQKIRLFNGKNLDNWNAIGDAKWKVVDGIIESNEGGLGFLVTKDIYKDYKLTVEFFVDEKANSGLILRWLNLGMISTNHFYEMNIYDKRPDPKYASGSIVGLDESNVPTAGKWNTMVMTAQGRHLTITMNGEKTADVEDTRTDVKLDTGFIGLQRDLGLVRFRKVELEVLGAK